MPQDVPSLLVALGGGLLSFLSPCVLPLVPAYFSSLAGPDVLDQPARRFRSPLFLHTLLFVLGFTVIFVGLGALTGLLGFGIISRLLARRIAGWLLIAMGTYMLLALKIPWLNFEKRLAPGVGKNTGHVRSLLVGGLFALAWTPCASPILGGVLGLAFQSGTAWKGAYLLAVYSVGLAIPFLAIGIAFDFLMPLLRKLQKYTPVIYVVSGILLIITGFLTLTTWWLQPLIG